MKMMQSSSEEQKNAARMQLHQRFSMAQLQEMQSHGKDPLILFYQNHAYQVLKTNAARQQQQQAQSGQMQNQTPAQAPMMQQQASQQALQQQNMNAGQEAGNDLSQFNPSMESIKDQQMTGFMAQKAGQMVVPASNAQNRNAGGQPMTQSMSNQPSAMQTPRPASQQQNNAMQQMKMNPAAQQSQAQLHAQQAQMKQVQPQAGNMGNMGAAQSPGGVGTLNTPVSRPPSGMNAMGNQAMGQGNAQFGSQQFNQGLQQAPNPAFNAMLANMSPEHRQQVSEMPAEKVQEIMRSWQMARREQMNGTPQQNQNQNAMVNRQPGQLGQMPPNMTAPGPQGMQQIGNPNQAQGRMPNPNAQGALMDSMDLPAQAINQISQFGQLPPEVKKWKDLKIWLSQHNTSLPQQVKAELSQWQWRQFQQVIQRRTAAQQGQMAGMNPGVQNAAGQMMNQQFQPGGMQQRQPVNANMPPYTVTAADLAAVRNSKPQLAHMSDDKLRTMLINMKQRKVLTQQQQQQHHALRVAQQAQNQVPGQQVGMSTMPTSQPPMPQQPMAQHGQRGPMGQGAPMQVNNEQKPQGAGQNQMINNRGNNGAAPVSTSPPTKNLKRPSSDDLTVTAAPNQHMPPQQQQQPRRPSQSQGSKAMAQPSADDMTQRKRPAPGTQPTQQPAGQAAQFQVPENLARLKVIGQQELRAHAQETMPDIPMSPEEHAETSNKLKRIVVDMSKIGRGLKRWYELTQDDERARQFFRTRLRIVKQFADGEQMTSIKEVLSINCAELDQARSLLESMAKDLANSVFGRVKPGMPQQGQQPQQQRNAQQQAQGLQQQAQQSGPAPLNAANLAKNSQALRAQKHSKQDIPPSAPTTTTAPPFPFQGAAGNPIYANAQSPVNMNLTIPPNKKAKYQQTHDSNASASPQAVKTSPPRTQNAPQRQPEPAKPILVCKEPECATSVAGYATEEALQRHMDEEHIKPKEDPLRFVKENLALALGLEPDGSVKKEQKPAVAPDMSLTSSKQGQTPGYLAAGTPLSQDSTAMKRSASTNKALGKGDLKPVDPWANVSMDSQALMNSLGLESGLNSVIMDPTAFRNLTPNDTPESSKDSGASEPNSDISEGATLDIGVHWQNIDSDLIFDMDKATLQGGFAGFGDSEVPTMDPSLLFNSSGMDVPDWDDLKIDFTKPFQLDTKLYSMDTL